MLDDLLPYYNQELNNIREVAEEFAKAHPKVARHLNMSHERVDDPDILRLIESFAFLTAQVKYKIDDDLPEILESVLSVINPIHLMPLPAVSIIQFHPHAELTSPYSIPKNTPIETIPSSNINCKFNTVYHTDLLPINLSFAEYKEVYSDEKIVESKKSPRSIIRMVVEYNDTKNTFSQKNPEKIRFFINAADHIAHRIYEMIFKHTIAIGLKSPDEDKIIFLSSDQIKPVGFDLEESIFSSTSQINQEYNILLDYFVFHEKFLFFELEGLNANNLSTIKDKLEIIFYCDEIDNTLTNVINSKIFKLGCTPVINLFEHFAEPINLDNNKHEYKIIPDLKYIKQELEIFSVKKVSVFRNDGVELEVNPLYGIKYKWNNSNFIPNFYWHIKRRINSCKKFEMFISFTDLEYNTLPVFEKIVYIESLCTNVDLPSHLPFGSQESILQISGKTAPVASIECLIPFNTSIQPKLRNALRWKIISHMTTNLLGISNQSICTDMLKEILSLYNLKSSESVKIIIDSIYSVECKKIQTRNLKSSRGAICHGIEILVKLEIYDLMKAGIYMFGCILDRIFAHFASINSFTKLTIFINNKEYHSWPIRLGSRPLL